MSVSLAAWHGAWRALGLAGGDAGLFHRLVAAWSEPQRHYHTLQHLRECLELFDGAHDLANHPGEIELALWFHDAVYDVQAHDNEARSADWARASILQAGGGAAAADRIHALVMATAHHAPVADADTQLLVDVDLAILGAAPARFDEYEAQVRAEYAHVPDAAFRSGRLRILQGFAGRPRLYGTAYFQERCEAAARANLQRALRRLD